MPVVCVVCSRLATSECGECKLAYYCGKECQTKDWASHQSKCSENIGVRLIFDLAHAEDLLAAIFTHKWGEIISTYAKKYPDKALDVYGDVTGHTKELKAATEEFVKFLLDSFDKKIDIMEDDRVELKRLFEKLNQIFYLQILYSSTGDTSSLEQVSDVDHNFQVEQIRDLILGLFKEASPRKWPEMAEAFAASNRQEVQVMQRIFNHFHGTITTRRWEAAKSILVDGFLSPLFTALLSLPSK